MTVNKIDMWNWRNMLWNAICCVSFLLLFSITWLLCCSVTAQEMSNVYNSEINLVCFQTTCDHFLRLYHIFKHFSRAWLSAHFWYVVEFTGHWHCCEIAMLRKPAARKTLLFFQYVGNSFASLKIMDTYK